MKQTWPNSKTHRNRVPGYSVHAYVGWLAVLACLLFPGAMTELSAADFEQAVAVSSSQQPIKTAASVGAFGNRALLWTMGAVEGWLIGCLSAWFLLLWLKPLTLKSIDDKLSQFGFGKSKGRGITLAHCALIRPFAQHKRVVDAWVHEHMAAVRDWHGASLDPTGCKIMDALCDGRTLDGTPAGLRKLLPLGQFAILIGDHSRRWQAQSLAHLLSWCLSEVPECRLASHALIPVVLDHKCLERLQQTTEAQSPDNSTSEEDAPNPEAVEQPTGMELLVQLLRCELSRLPMPADVWSERWVRTLLASGRVLIVADEWQRLPQTVQDAIRYEFLAESLPAVVVVACGGELGSLPNSILLTEFIDADAANAPAPNEISQPVAVDAVDAHETPTDAIESNTSEEADEAEPQIISFAAAQAENEQLIGGETLAAQVSPAKATHTHAVATIAPANNTVESVAAMSSVVLEAVPKLTQALDRGDVPTRRRAAQELADLMLRVMPALADALADDDVAVRRDSVLALSQLQSAIQPAVAKTVNDPDSEVCRLAALAVAHIDERVVAPLIRTLDDSAPDARRAAALALGRLGSMATEAIPSLIRMLDDGQIECRSAAAAALGRLGREAHVAVPALAERLQDGAPAVRQAAAKSLGQLASPQIDAVHGLCDALKDADANVRLYASWSLGEFKGSWPEIIVPLKNALRDAEPEIRCQAARSLSAQGTGARSSVPALAALLNDASVDVRRAAVEAVAKVDLSAVPVLQQALDDSDAEVRRIASSGLSSIGLSVIPQLNSRADAISNVNAENAQSLAQLEALLQSMDAAQRERAVSALAPLGDLAVPMLCRALDDASPEVRRRSAAALGRIGGAAELAIPALNHALRDEDVAVRREAVSALGYIGGPAQQVVPGLARALADLDAEIRNRAAASLGHLGRDAVAALPSLMHSLSDPDAGVRTRAAMSIGALGPSAKSAVTTLIRALRDPESDVRWQASAALSQVGAAAVPELAACLTDEDADVRRCVADALDRLGPAASEATAALQAAMQDSDAVVRRSVASALGRIGEPATEAVPHLVRALADFDVDVRRNAVAAMGRIGNVSPAVLPALQAALRDPAEKVRTAAASSLDRLVPSQTRAA